ncbi:hypothetical protein AX16_008095 [Volvariella volvacea WC 439]|nr:hypothetical protein AX16_008095 [Volvariella volvacea WC 439]
MPTVVHSLPPELIYTILDFASIKEQTLREPDYRFLRGCAEVHSYWTASAQALLFRHVDYERCIKFAEFISSATPSARSRLLPHTQILEIGLTSKEVQHGADCHEEHFLTILINCPQIRDLTLRVFGLFQHHPDTMTMLRDLIASNGSIQYLQVLSHSVETPTVFPILTLFSTVTTLTVATELAVSPREAPPPTFQLHELILYRVPHIPTLAWLLSSSSHSLRTLEIRDAIDFNAGTVLERYAPNLETLRVMGCTPQSFRLINMCTNLKAMSVYNLAKITPFPPIPPSIERLAFMHASVAHYQLAPIIQAIDRLPRLRMIRCEHDTEAHPAFPELQTKCEERGVAIDTTTKYVWSLIAH